MSTPQNPASTSIGYFDRLQAQEAQRVLKELNIPKEPLISRTELLLNSYVTQDEEMIELKKKIAKLAPKDVNILILGETGTGKEIIAEALHGQRQGEFVAVNAASISGSLMEAEFLGAKKGSYTGCDKDRNGFFQKAAGGTIFLDEISELPRELQAKLLRVTEKKELIVPTARGKATFTKKKVLSFWPVGGSDGECVTVSCRIVAASNRLNILDTDFRQDLYARLATVTLRTKPLRERRKDIPLIVKHYDKDGIIPEAIINEWQHNSEAYPFRRNVRELYNMIQEYVALNENDELE